MQNAKKEGNFMFLVASIAECGIFCWNIYTLIISTDIFLSLNFFFNSKNARSKLILNADIRPSGGFPGSEKV